MKIDTANIVLASQHQAVQRHTVKESLWVRAGNQEMEIEQSRSQGSAGADYELSISHSAQDSAPADVADAVRRQTAQRLETPAASAGQTEALDDGLEEATGDPELRMLKLLFKKVFGVEVKEMSFEDVEKAKAEAEDTPPPLEAVEEESAWGVEYQRHEEYYEAERTEVSASGVIETADGQQIQFDLHLNMSREFLAEHSLDIRLGNATKDPLVINFDGSAAQLSDAKFVFDLDADGAADQISFVTPNSGFLALDKNGDGVINDGKELFGPASGNGFQDLSAYDQDGNLWIDERDAVFDQLQVWVKDEAGEDQLVSLADKGIGAIYLQPTSSDFSVKDQQNALQAQVRSSSIYASEDGTVGTVQQLDLAV